MDKKFESPSEEGIQIIWNYINQDFSWKQSIFNNLSLNHQILFFLPALFVFPPIYGTYELFYHHSWGAFILCGIIMLLSIYWFFQQKAKFERIAIRKNNTLQHGSNINEFHKQNLIDALGVRNTIENRTFWKSYFEKKSKNKNLRSGATIVFFVICCVHYGLPIGKDHLSSFYIIEMSFVSIIIAVSIVMPAFCDINFKTSSYKQAQQLILELDKE